MVSALDSGSSPRKGGGGGGTRSLDDGGSNQVSYCSFSKSREFFWLPQTICSEGSHW